jgi:uncharacterized membrane protein
VNNKRVSWLLVLLLAGVSAFFLWQLLQPVELPDVNMSSFGSETVRARVTGIIEEGEIDLGGTVQRYQVARVELLEGEYRGIEMEMDYGRRGVLSNAVYLQPGDTVLVTIGARPDGILTVYFADFERATSLLWLTGIFMLVILIMSGWKGLRSILSMAFSLLVIIGYIIPNILAGGDPLWVSITGSIILLGLWSPDHWHACSPLCVLYPVDGVGRRKCSVPPSNAQYADQSARSTPGRHDYRCTWRTG